MRCPYCGSESLTWVENVRGEDVPLDCSEGWQAIYRCNECGSEAAL